MTDDELDSLIDALKPDLRIALRSVLEGELVHAFDIDGRKDGKKMESVATIFIAKRPVAVLIESVMEGLIKSQEKMMEEIMCLHKEPGV